MKNTKLPLLFFITILFATSNFFGQGFQLEIVSTQKIENNVLKKIEFKKTHENKSSIKLEAQKIIKYLKTIGYFTNTIDSSIYKKKKTTFYFNLGKKIDTVIITINNIDKHLLEEFKAEDNSIKIPIKKLDYFLTTVSKNLDNEGKTFSKVNLKNTKVNKNYLFASLVLEESKKRNIQKVIIKGYDNFPRGFIKNYYKIKKNIIFNKEKLTEIYKQTNELNFVKQLKKPEVLFKPDSTYIYVYLRKKTNNSIDALLNYGSKENGAFFFNGNVNIELNNIFNYGEEFKLNWNKINEERQEISISVKTPYIFKSTISPEINFSIYRQDSSFITSKLRSFLHYEVNSKHAFSFTYDTESSEKNNSTNLKIEKYKNYFLGLGYQFQKEFRNKNKIQFHIATEFGDRITSVRTKQQKLSSSASYKHIFNKRSHFYLKNSTGYLSSKNFILNELYRIGGVNSVRGFNEQSIFTDKYSYFNIEYRYKTNETSYLYTITDIGIYSQDLQGNSLLGLGIGYLYNTKKYQINLGLATGKINEEKINFENAKLILSWKNYF